MSVIYSSKPWSLRRKGQARLGLPNNARLFTCLKFCGQRSRVAARNVQNPSEEGWRWCLTARPTSSMPIFSRSLLHHPAFDIPAWRQATSAGSRVLNFPALDLQAFEIPVENVDEQGQRAIYNTSNSSRRRERKCLETGEGTSSIVDSQDVMKPALADRSADAPSTPSPPSVTDQKIRCYQQTYTRSTHDKSLERDVARPSKEDNAVTRTIGQQYLSSAGRVARTGSDAPC
ncbi:hypothetical protein FB45DRAFT_999057 [Roridomyces roridus]|uniref:Uncharacterized protein n=1 Tax=Roridomyces roridus TaxID=1738132 RepID=A0AAD7CA86_9AGAR|nr:hypothetical protein FB45DRAFT_999057 [Roridomyces roridus]